MSSFTTELAVSPMPDGRSWRLLRSFRYHIDSHYSNKMVCVPEGFVTDFASIPWVFWSFLPSWGKYGKAAVVHDYLYQNPYKTTISSGVAITRYITREEADNIFYEAMLVGGTKPWKARVMYWAVRLFGWAAWRER